MIEEAFTYRQLRRSDFRSTALPPDRTMHESSINAYTCTRIRPTQDSRYTVNRAQYNDNVFYIGSIQNIGFEAIMIPGCSWWNPALAAVAHSYVLQHEQIHFAIVELTARQLTTKARQSALTFMAIQPNSGAAMAEVNDTVNTWIRAATEESLDMHTAFDEDTSLFHSPKWQHWWKEKINSKLAKFEPAASTGTDISSNGKKK